MTPLTRRELLWLTLAASAGLIPGEETGSVDVHQQILDLAARYEKERRARFAAVSSEAELKALQAELRATFLRLLGGLPGMDGPAQRRGAPRVTQTGQIDADDYLVEKLVYESLPGYLVPALLYRPKHAEGRRPGVLSPCGHSAVGKAADLYQILHINLARRGFVVLTYDPVGQGERSQFWDAGRHRTRFDLGCGEHAVMGNPLYLLGWSLARFRIWDGLRGIDYLAARPDVDPQKIGCVGNSGGGTLTAYIAALDDRVTAAAICCYITTLRRRMGNRTQEDPSSDPEQDIFGFVSEGLDHAGLLALRAPKPTLLGTARFDFFPIEGARETFEEGKRLFEVAGAGDRIARAEAAEKHGLTLTLRQAVYGWFDRWLAGRGTGQPAQEPPTRARPPAELTVCADGQVNVTFHSRPLLPLALDEFRQQPPARRQPLARVLNLDHGGGDPRIDELGAEAAAGKPLVVLVNGNEAPDWREQRTLLAAVRQAGCGLVVVDPRGVGPRRLALAVKGHEYTDPISGVEENLAYNAFLVGQSLVGLRTADVLTAVASLQATRKPGRIVLLGRRDAALVACCAAAAQPAIAALATEGLLPSYLPLFSAEGFPLNAASILPGLLRDFGDVPEILAAIAPRRILVAAAAGEMVRGLSHVQLLDKEFHQQPEPLIEWLRGVVH